MPHYDIKETNENEMFLGNTSKFESFPPAHLKELKTIRLGKHAYDINGNELTPDECRPIFIHKSEYNRYNAIMEQRVRDARNGKR